MYITKTKANSKQNSQLTFTVLYALDTLQCFAGFAIAQGSNSGKKKTDALGPNLSRLKTPQLCLGPELHQSFHSINSAQGYHYTFLIMSCFVTSIAILNEN